MTDDARDEWGEFPCTHLHFVDVPALTLDVRARVTPEMRAGLAAHGLTGSFVVVTAQDPMGRPQSPDVNARLAAKLQDRVATLNIPFARVEACSPDRSHCEESVAVVSGRDAGVRLACEFEQLAIFWFDGDAFWIVPAKSSKHAVRLAPEH